MGARPWSDWIPGVLGKGQMTELCGDGYIQNANLASLDHSSIDLHLTHEAWELTRGSIKPFGRPYLHFILKQKLAQPIEQKDGSFVLQHRHTYLFRLKERLSNLNGSSIHGQATAKSSVGRVDVLARLIVDGMSRYEGFSPEGLTCGDLFLEITPMTFPVRVKPGSSLSQLRLFYGRPDSIEMRGRELWECVLREGAGDDTLSVDLRPCPIGGVDASAFFAEIDAKSDKPIVLYEQDVKPNPWEFWRVAMADADGRLEIQKNRFYILRSKERIVMPPGIAVYCRAIDETIGEIRIHYAGFVHPCFGLGRPEGTPLIFEVRGHDLNVNLIQGETMARLIFYRMSCDAQPGGEGSYINQELELSKFFGPWPAKVRRSESEGQVVPEPSDATN